MSLLATFRRSPGYGVASYSPLSQLHRDFDRFFSGQSTQPEANPVDFVPAIDVQEDENHLTVTADLPGVAKENVQVALHDGVLTISGERRRETEAKEDAYYLRERSYGRFQRSLRVNIPISADSVKAAYKEGVLTVTLPKTPEAKPRQININAN